MFFVENILKSLKHLVCKSKQTRLMHEFNPIIVLVVKKEKKSSILKRCEWVNLSRNTIFYIDTNTLNQMSISSEMKSFMQY